MSTICVRSTQHVYVDDVLHRWVVELVRATREQEAVVIGSSVRGSLALERAARAWALLDGRAYVVPEDIELLFVPVLVHRVVFSPGFVARARATGWNQAIEDFRASCLEIAPRPGSEEDPFFEKPSHGAGQTPRGPTPAGSAAWRAPGSRSRSFPDGGSSASPSARCEASAAAPAPTSPARDRTARATTWTRSTGRRRRACRPRKGSDEFVVRERFAEEAPKVVIVCDRRPEMSFFAPSLPWLDKPQAMRQAVELILASAGAAGGFVGYLDYADGDPHWRQPKGERKLIELRDDRLWSSEFAGPPDWLERSFEHMAAHTRAVTPGTFVFLLSDFLPPPPRELWLAALEHRWDLVPVVIQDPDLGAELSRRERAGRAAPRSAKRSNRARAAVAEGRA